jgi:hypothetical protein
MKIKFMQNENERKHDEKYIVVIRYFFLFSSD